MIIGLRRKFASAHFAKIHSFKVFFPPRNIHESRQIYVEAKKYWISPEILEKRRTNIQQSFFAWICAKIIWTYYRFNPTLIPLKMFQHWQIWKLQAYGGTHANPGNLRRGWSPPLTPPPPRLLVRPTSRYQFANLEFAFFSPSKPSLPHLCTLHAQH